MNKDERIEWIDIAKAIGIFLVVLGHVCTNNIAHSIIYSFHMPLFFIISGYLYKIEKKDRFLKKNFKSLMIPFYFYGILSFLYWFVIERRLRNQLISPIKPLCNFMLFNGSTDWFIENAALWFLPCLFIIKMIVYFYENKLYKDTKPFKILIAILISIITGLSYYVYKILNLDLFFMINRIGIYLPFFLFGMYIFKGKVFNNYKSIKKLIIYLIIFISVSIWNLNTQNNFIIFILYWCLAISGSMFILEISKFINFSWMEFCGINTLIILCIHEPIKRILIKFTSIVFKISEEILRDDVLLSIVTSVFLILILVPCIWIINKWFPFTLGKNTIRSNLRFMNSNKT